MKRIAALLFFLAGALLAQPIPPPTIVYVSSAPSGACGSANLPLRYVTGAGTLYGCVGSVWTQIVGSGGTGTVTVVASGVLINGACVTGGGTTTVQTPAATCTVDSSGNIVATSVQAGSGSGVAGVLDITQGTLPSSFPANTFSWYAPTSIPTSYQWKPPAADAAGAIVSNGAGTPGALSIKAFTGTEAKIVTSAGGLIAGNCIQAAVGGGVSDTGSVCGAGGGGASGNSITNVTPVTATANTTSDQSLMELTLSAGYLNSLRQPFVISAAGVYTTPVAQTPTLTYKAKLCTVSGCGSGTVVTLGTITSTATLASVTNNQWNLQLISYTATVGATGNLEVHGNLTVDLGALTATADSVFADTNTAVSSNIDLTAALFIDFTVATSTGSASNAITQRSGGIMPFAATAAPVTSVNGSTGAVTVSAGPYVPQSGTGATTTATIPTTGWSIVNGAVVNDFFANYISLLITDNASTNRRFYTRTNASSNYTTYATISVNMANSAVNSQIAGVYISDGTKYEGIELVSQNAGPNQLRIVTAASTTSSDTAIFGPTANLTGRVVAVKIVDNGSTRVWSYWTAGAWVQALSEASHTFLTETKAGFGGLSIVGSTNAFIENDLLFWSQQ